MFSDKYLWNDKKFTIHFDETMKEIIIDKYQKDQNGSVITPTIATSLAYITSAKKL